MFRRFPFTFQVLPGRTLVVYQEVYDNNITLPPKVAFDVWKAGGDMAGGHGTASVPAEVARIVKGGHQAILANGNDRNWYLHYYIMLFSVFIPSNIDVTESHKTHQLTSH